MATPATAPQPAAVSRRTPRPHTGGWTRLIPAVLREDRLVQVIAALGVLIRVVYWQITDRRFEDGLITVTHARSVIEGIGLTHHPGEPVTHGFTSAISVLIPLAGELAGEVLPKVDGFMALRLSSLVAFVVAIAAAGVLTKALGIGGVPRVFVLGFLAVDYNQIFYGMAGMETQVAIAILLCACVALVQDRVTWLGVLLGLCVLVRPDFVLFLACVFGALLLQRRWRDTGRVALLTAAVAAPWFLFAWIYYGSPIPNTIGAKALRMPVGSPESAAPGDVWTWISTKVSERIDLFWHSLTPFQENGFVTDAPLLPFFSMAIAVVIVGLALVGAGVTWRALPAWRPVIAFVALFTAYRFIALPSAYYEWYYPPVTALTVILAGAGLTQFARLGPKTVAVAAAALLALFAWPIPTMMRLDRDVQQNIENKVRVQVGHWLQANVEPGRIVSSEPAGYFGFYGRTKLWDYPGLTSKQARAIMEDLPEDRRGIYDFMEAANPDYIVFRPGEWEAFAGGKPEAAARYRPVAEFGVTDESTPLRRGGVEYVNVDRRFIVVERPPGR